MARLGSADVAVARDGVLLQHGDQVGAVGAAGRRRREQPPGRRLPRVGGKDAGTGAREPPARQALRQPPPVVVEGGQHHALEGRGRGDPAWLPGADWRRCGQVRRARAAALGLLLARARRRPRLVRPRPDAAPVRGGHLRTPARPDERRHQHRLGRPPHPQDRLSPVLCCIHGATN